MSYYFSGEGALKSNNWKSELATVKRLRKQTIKQTNKQANSQNRKAAKKKKNEEQEAEPTGNGKQKVSSNR